MSDDKHDVDGLLRKNAELLSEVKAMKAKVTEVEGERDNALGEAVAAKEVARQVSIERPLEAALGSAFVAPWRVVRPLLDEHFDFALGDDGIAAIADKTGGELAFDKLLEQANAIPDLAVMLKPPSGGGAKASSAYHGSEKPVEKQGTGVASPFGLR